MLTLPVVALAAPAMAAIDLDRLPAGVVVHAPGDPCTGSGLCGAGGTDIDMTFVDPADPRRKGSTSAFSIEVDEGARAMITAYDASGRLLGVADRSDANGAAERLTLTGLGDIARVHVSARGPLAVNDLQIAEVDTNSHLPEPATWAMFISGFLLTAAMIRRCIRRSEARFTERVRRIAAGEAG